MTTNYNRSYTVFESVPSSADFDGPDTCVDLGGLICSACGGEIKKEPSFFEGLPFHPECFIKWWRRECGRIIYTRDESGGELTHEEIRGQVPVWHPVTCGGCKHLEKCRGEKPESSNIRPRSRGSLPCYEEGS